MTPPKASPTVLEGFYNVKQATVKLGLATEDENDKTGQKWLRDGVNLKGWPHHRMARQLVFSDTDLAEIARLSRTPATKPGRKPGTRARTRKVAVAKPAKTESASSERPAA